MLEDTRGESSIAELGIPEPITLPDALLQDQQELAIDEVENKDDHQYRQ